MSTIQRPALYETKECTAYGLAMVPFVSPLAPAVGSGGQIGVATSMQGPLSHKTRLKSGVGRRSTNAIIAITVPFYTNTSGQYQKTPVEHP